MVIKAIAMIIAASILGAAVGMFYTVVVITIQRRIQRWKRFQNVKKYTKKTNKMLRKMGKSSQEILEFHEAVLQEAMIQVQLPPCNCTMEVESCDTFCQFNARKVMSASKE